MNGEPATEIKFFDVSSRIGRLRYLAYAVGLMLLMLPLWLVGGALFAFKLRLLAGLLLAVAYIFFLVVGVTFMIRRLHDMNFSGWWLLIFPIVILTTVIGIFAHGSVVLTLINIPLVLAELALSLGILFWPGTSGDNRFGPQPPPNTGWVIAGAWTYILIIPLMGILAAIAIPAYQDYIARSQMSEGIQLAGSAEVPVSEFYEKNKTWPTDISTLYPKSGPVGRYVETISTSTSADGSFGVIATMKQTGVNRFISGRAVELWTADGGKIWYCGPASNNAVDPKYLPTMCRDGNPPPP